MKYHEAQKIINEIEHRISAEGYVGTYGDYLSLSDEYPDGQEALAITLAAIPHTINAVTRVINCTPHPIRLQKNEIPCPSCGILNARIVDENMVCECGLIAHADENEILVVIPPSGITLPAHAEEEIVDERNQVQFVETVFIQDDAAAMDVAALKTRWGSDVLLIGSIISAQAYAPHVVSMVPVPGFERTDPSKKRMRADKFNIYSRSL